ncbi:hypothetical protein [Inhella gelatinilytica]|uniref:Tetratricopeptide repeat protein n=1 Tax=Inhella gelatinilytica TaxID=2795030 RepID=A0A931IT37_9BURK|nr:hypothetical protein [Inhella gelatinilytica]MBH9552220.1 hypothetical protein [Inhella gelatinilytica]
MIKLSGSNSRLLRKLEQDLAVAQREHQHLRAHCLRARRAGLLARLGQQDSARSELTSLHQVAFASPNARLSAWLCWAESQVAYYTQYDMGAVGWLVRAEEQGRAAECLEVRVEALAFLAHLAFADHRPEDAADAIQRCLALGAPEHGPALARLHMVVGQAWHLARGVDQGYETAQPWYTRARSFAAACGDDALISALMYNSATLRVACVREAELAEGRSEAPVPLAAVDSVSHFDQAMGVAGLRELTPLARAQMLVSAGRFAEAMVLMPHNLDDTQRLSLGRLSPALRADWAWCAVNLGDPTMARAQADQALLEIGPHCHADDRGCTHARVAQVYGQLGLSELAQAQCEKATSAWSEWRTLQARWRAALAPHSLPDAQ